MNTTDATKYLKKLSMPRIDDVLAYSGLQRAPSGFSRFLAGAGLISLGAIVGAGLSVWFGTPKNRKAVSTAFTNGLDKVSTLVSNGVNTASAQVSNGIANGKTAVKTATR